MADYTMRKGKDAAIAGRRHRMEEAQHSASNNFVKAEQMKLARKGGQAPKLEGKYMDFCSPMTNNGVHAQELAKKLTAGIDHDAFPVRQDVDKTQD